MTNVLFGLPQVLSSFLMIIICCFTDCAAATVLAYETPEADVLLRRPRKFYIPRSSKSCSTKFEGLAFLKIVIQRRMSTFQGMLLK